MAGVIQDPILEFQPRSYEEIVDSMIRMMASAVAEDIEDLCYSGAETVSNPTLEKSNISNHVRDSK